jgi:hypothetical protein
MKKHGRYRAGSPFALTNTVASVPIAVRPASACERKRMSRSLKCIAICSYLYHWSKISSGSLQSFFSGIVVLSSRDRSAGARKRPD